MKTIQETPPLSLTGHLRLRPPAMGVAIGTLARVSFARR